MSQPATPPRGQRRARARRLGTVRQRSAAWTKRMDRERAKRVRVQACRGCVPDAHDSAVSACGREPSRVGRPRHVLDLAWRTRRSATWCPSAADHTFAEAIDAVAIDAPSGLQATSPMIPLASPSCHAKRARTIEPPLVKSCYHHLTVRHDRIRWPSGSSDASWETAARARGRSRPLGRVDHPRNTLCPASRRSSAAADRRA